MGWSENNRNQWTKMGLYFCAKKKKNGVILLCLSHYQRKKIGNDNLSLIKGAHNSPTVILCCLSRAQIG